MGRGRFESQLRAAELLDVVVERGVYRGLGLARHQGQVVFVPGGLPGDHLRVRVESIARDYVTAGIEELLAAAPGRRAAPCSHARECGGCAYQGLEYAQQLELKAAILGDCLDRAGVDWGGELHVAGSPERAWRTRASFHVATERGSVRLGLYRAGSTDVVDLETCLQVSPAMNEAVCRLREALRGHSDLAGRVTNVTLAESGDGAQLVAALETRLAEGEAGRLQPLADAAPGLSGLAVLAGRGRRRRHVVQRGKPYVYATVMGTRLRHHVGSFFQANRFLVEELVRHVMRLTPPGGPVLDLYGGVGLFALALAPAATRVIGVEAQRLAVQDAAFNLKVSAVQNVHLQAGQTLDALGSLPREADERVVLDPPRGGLGPRVVRAVAQRRPGTVIYVSCDPPTLARDLRDFASCGYRPDSLQALDMFPDTFHLETIARLKPAD